MQRRATEKELNARLSRAYAAWNAAGQPAWSDESEALVNALAAAYVGSSEQGRERVAAMIEDLGADDAVNETIAEWEPALYTHDILSATDRHLDKATDPRVKAVVTAALNDPELQDWILTGEADPHALESDLHVVRISATEHARADDQRAELEALDEELVRASALDEETEMRYRAELAASTEAQTRPDPQAIARAFAIERGERPRFEPLVSEQEEIAELRRMGMIPDPVDDARRERWHRESVEAKRAEAADRTEGRL